MGIYLENRYSIRYKQTKYSKLDTSSLSPSTPQYFRVYHFTSAAATTPANVYLFRLVILAFQHIFPVPLQVETQPHRILSSNNCIEWGRGSTDAKCCGRGRENESILYCWRLSTFFWQRKLNHLFGLGLDRNQNYHASVGNAELHLASPTINSKAWQFWILVSVSSNKCLISSIIANWRLFSLHIFFKINLVWNQ